MQLSRLAYVSRGIPENHEDLLDYILNSTVTRQMSVAINHVSKKVLHIFRDH